MRSNRTQDVREFFVEDLKTTRRFSISAEAGWKFKSLKQKVGEFEFPACDGTMNTIGTELVLKTEIDAIRVLIPTKGRWMLTYKDTFEFTPDTGDTAEFKVIVNRASPRGKRPMREHFKN